ncbi:hypothetical protein SBA1_520002 [Candidatus Sulfotelmatobacter kueseliae]|uniref:Uncharacterized protein n=1 Tax=Candidatus Sulfotelmatobacter kueseliae TaxID=2042962 RepID=A0A2U3KWS9_9BACT|nr:hypothetical protein SBA1_520002 [Candidatus Sulfotelmatobacter kueseliae]
MRFVLYVTGVTALFLLKPQPCCTSEPGMEGGLTIAYCIHKMNQCFVPGAIGTRTNA